MNEMTPSFEQWRSLRLARIERALDVALPPANTRLHQVMRYAVLGNGKRIRPLLCVAAGEWAGAPDHALDAAAAILAGDALQTQAFMTLIEGELAPLQCAALVRELATASGSAGMAGGQAMDIESAGAHPTHAALEKMARMKTGALLRAAVRMGALCAASPTENADIPPFPEALERYASAI